MQLCLETPPHPEERKCCSRSVLSTAGHRLIPRRKSYYPAGTAACALRQQSLERCSEEVSWTGQALLVDKGPRGFHVTCLNVKSG